MVNNIHNGEELQASLLGSGRRQRCPLLFHIILVVLVYGIRKLKCMQIVKNNKTIGYMIVYLGNLDQLTIYLHELIGEYSRVV